jgi:acyl-CoA thioester hydrolase
VPFEKTFEVAWAQLDANGHMANTAYLDVCVDVRFAYFISQGFPPSEFARLRLGPAVRRDEVDYYRELHMLQPIRVTLVLAGLSDDASRFRLRNEIFLRGPPASGTGSANWQLAARVTSLGGWLDLNARKLVAPPDDLAKALRTLDRSEDFEKLESSLRK